jgi:hypothetical protein
MLEKTLKLLGQCFGVAALMSLAMIGFAFFTLPDDAWDPTGVQIAQATAVMNYAFIAFVVLGSVSLALFLYRGRLNQK